MDKKAGDLPIKLSKKERERQVLDESDKALLEEGAHFGLPVLFDLSPYPFIQDRVQMLPYAFVRSRRLLPLEDQGGVYLVAISDPLNFYALQEARVLLKKEVREVLVNEEELDLHIERCYHQREEVAAQFIASLQDQKEGDASLTAEMSEEYDLLSQKEDSPVIRMLNVMLAEAVQQGVSDIHFEPYEEGLHIRYRIDGMLQLRHTPPKEYGVQLITRIKVMARLDIAEHRLPQDGRMKLTLGGRPLDFRVSTIPVAFGERTVLRILDQSSILLGLDQLGISEEMLADLNRLIHMSEGILLVTGPTGSGKTTTLYSALSEIGSSEVNIMTIEDPVEFKLPGMAQMNVNPKIQLTFAKGLRHILRQDPDVIMIGEIRDRETAEIAIQSSLTGHLVLSTLHTNDAPSALTRLIDMGIEPFLLSSTVVGVLAQRLVRMICNGCKRSYTPSDGELKDLGLMRAELQNGKLFRGSGCPDCYHSGYKGRHGIYELMVMCASIKEQLLKSGGGPLLQKTASESGMCRLRKSGAILAQKGVTTSAEVLRVACQYEES